MLCDSTKGFYSLLVCSEEEQMPNVMEQPKEESTKGQIRYVFLLPYFSTILYSYFNLLDSALSEMSQKETRLQFSFVHTNCKTEL